MYKGFKEVVERIIKKYGDLPLQAFYEAEQIVIKVEMANFLPFTIEKQGNMLYVGYYRVINGDSASDPIFVFQLDEDLEWCPIRLEQLLGTTEIGEFEHGRYYYYQGYFKDARSFATACSKEWKAYYL